jgi:hypothetical protein
MFRTLQHGQTLFQGSERQHKFLDHHDTIEIVMNGISLKDRLCGLVVRVLGYRSGGPGSIPGTIRKKK